MIIKLEGYLFHELRGYSEHPQYSIGLDYYAEPIIIDNIIEDLTTESLGPYSYTYKSPKKYRITIEELE